MFYDRREAGQQLAHRLGHYQNKDVVVFGLPRGGVIVAAEVAHFLEAPLGIVVTRKVAHPGSPEYAIGATAEHTKPIFNEIEAASVDPRWLKNEIEAQRQEIARRKASYLQNHRQPVAFGKTAILVDDGIATGLTMQAAIEELREQDPRELIVAVPVAPADTSEVLEDLADEVFVLERPRAFLGSVGAYYEHFDQTSDEEVIEVLDEVSEAVSSI